jgi:zinc protease
MIRSFSLSVVAVLAVAALAVAAPAAALPPGITQVTSVEGIHEYKLDNGLRVLLFPDPSKQTTTVNITILVGSGHEGYGETGMAHLLEHMVFQGSPRHEDIPTELTSHGARANGTTWFDRTNYFETFATTDENLEWALDLEADRLVNSYVSREDLDSEMTVVRNEFEIGENYPEQVLEERVYSTAFLWHNYGNTTIGARADDDKVPLNTHMAF